MLSTDGFGEELFIEEEKVEDLRFDKQEHLVGSRARQNFWDLYKSERAFKDFKPLEEETADPRFAYF